MFAYEDDETTDGCDGRSADGCVPAGSSLRNDAVGGAAEADIHLKDTPASKGAPSRTPTVWLLPTVQIGSRSSTAILAGLTAPAIGLFYAIMAL